MANPIPCDNTEAHPDPAQPIAAVMLLTNIEIGEAFSLCGPCFVDFCTATARQAEAQAPQPEPASDDTGDDTDDDTDEDAVQRLESVELGPANGTAGPIVVRRGTSKSRKAYEARKRQKGSDSDAVHGQESTEQPEPSADILS